MSGWIGGWVNMDGWMGGCVGGWIWMGRWMDRWVDGLASRLHFPLEQSAFSVDVKNEWR